MHASSQNVSNSCFAFLVDFSENVIHAIFAQEFKKIDW